MDSDSIPNSSSATRFGATPIGDDKTRFVVWAQKAKHLQVHITKRENGGEIFDRSVELASVDGVVFSGVVENCPVGTLYR